MLGRIYAKYRNYCSKSTMRSCSVDSTALRCVSVYVDKVCLSRRYGLSGRGIWTWATVIGRRYCTASQR